MSKITSKPQEFRPRLTAIAAATLWLCATSAQAAGLQASSHLDESADTINEESASFISARHLETTDDKIYLRGDAEVRRAGTVIRGDSITYSQENDQVDVEGDAVVIRDGVRFSGPKLSYQIETESGEMHDVEYQYPSQGIRGSTEYAKFIGGESTTLKKATITTCKPGSKAWWVQADQLTIDENSQFATARNASLHIGGVPVLGTPWAMFPVGTERQSGLLTPTLGMSSSRGVDVMVPIYWNIAPNYDYTFTPRMMTKRGVLLGNEFRFLTDHLYAEMNYDYLHEDKETDETRYAGRVKAEGHWKGLRLDVDYNKVSDGEYLSDFSGNIYESSESILDQKASLRYGQDFWNASLSVHKNQPLERSNGELYSKPYEKVPQFKWSAYAADVYGFEISSLVEATRFRHPDEQKKAQGNRFYMNHAVSYPMMGPGWFLTPKAMLTGISYDLNSLNKLTNGLQDTLDKNAAIVAPSFSLDAGLVFERDASWFGTDAIQTLEPRVYYVYTPYRDQSDMPNFDTSLADLSFAGLFTENTYTGHDRLSEANHISLVLTSRYLDRKSGAEWLSASIGQRYYFEDQNVALYPNRSYGVTDSSHSDWLGNVTAHLTKDISASATAQYSTAESRFTRINAGIRWQPKPSSVIGLYYRYNYAPLDPDDHIKQIDLAAQWPLTDSLYGLARFNYSLHKKEPVEALAGVEYVADCWALRLVAQRYITDEDEYDTTFFVQLELTGLGSIGKNPISELRRNIPGYHAATATPTRTGLYDYYE